MRLERGELNLLWLTTFRNVVFFFSILGKLGLKELSRCAKKFGASTRSASEELQIASSLLES